MNLIPFRLIALGVYTETGGGILALSPPLLVFYVGNLCRATTLEAIRDCVPVDLRHSFDNYLTVWGELLEEVLQEDLDGPGAGQGDTVELTDQGAALAAELEDVDPELQAKIDGAWDAATAGLDPTGIDATEAEIAKIEDEANAQRLATLESLAETAEGQSAGAGLEAGSPAPEPPAKPRRKSKRRIAAAGRRTRIQGRFAANEPAEA